MALMLARGGRCPKENWQRGEQDAFFPYSEKR